MVPRQLAIAMMLTALTCISGCHSTSNRVSYSTQPTCVAAPPPPCGATAAPCPNAAVVPPPPPGFVR
jgi:hypothetical protein